MYTKQDFLKAVDDLIANYPAIEPFYRAADPRILQHLEAIATMLAMFSAQLDIAAAEPFEKTRDSTILADSAMRGIIRRATPARIDVSVENKSNKTFFVEPHRVLLDSKGRHWKIETPLTLEGGKTGLISCVQLKQKKLHHIISESTPFYAIEIPPNDDGTHIAGVKVYDRFGVLEHRARYVNTYPHERVFHIEVDEKQRIYIRFGYQNIVGIQPEDGEKIEFEVFYTTGDIAPELNSPFSFEYLIDPAESALDMRMKTLTMRGQNPPSIRVLRDLARYPSTYDDNAVFLGEFDFIVRKNISDLRFLSVWNESLEEKIRGSNVDNINCLFVACFSSAEIEQVKMNESDAPDLISSDQFSPTQKEIQRIILNADDSYKIKFVTPVRSKIHMNIHATVSTSYLAGEVKKQIASIILEHFGEYSEAAKRGRHKPLNRRVHQLLRDKIPLLNEGEADLKVQIEESPFIGRPELWRFVSPDSLNIHVETANIIVPSWGAGT